MSANVWIVPGSGGNGGSLNVDGSSMTRDLTVIGSNTNNNSVDLIGGSGNDLFVVRNEQINNNDTFAGGAGKNTIQVTNGANVVDNEFTSVSGIQTLMLGNFGNQVTLGPIAATAIGAGNTFTIDDSTASPGLHVSVMTGFGSASNLNVIGGSGADQINLTNANGTNTITGGGGADTLTGGSATNSICICCPNRLDAECG
jgi:hypothetical protein